MKEGDRLFATTSLPHGVGSLARAPRPSPFSQTPNNVPREWRAYEDCRDAAARKLGAYGLRLAGCTPRFSDADAAYSPGQSADGLAPRARAHATQECPGRTGRVVAALRRAGAVLATCRSRQAKIPHMRAFPPPVDDHHQRKGGGACLVVGSSRAIVDASKAPPGRSAAPHTVADARRAHARKRPARMVVAHSSSAFAHTPSSRAARGGADSKAEHASGASDERDPNRPTAERVRVLEILAWLARDGAQVRWCACSSDRRCDGRGPHPPRISCAVVFSRGTGR